MDLIKESLDNSDVPLTASDIWKKAEESGLTKKLSSFGKTPVKTLSARLYVDIRDNEKTLFYQVSRRPAKFYLFKKKEIVNQDEEITENNLQTLFNERDLHKLLSTFVQGDSHFKCMTKTIYHEKSNKNAKGKNQWLHPDLVGVYYPFLDYSDQVLKLLSVVGENPYKLFSFEIKKEINYSNLREYYFQAVSNSSWSHEGYLVTLKIEEDEDFYEELRRLNNAFGIGIIRLNASNVSQSEILFQAQENNGLDWITIERLSYENKDFRLFIEDIALDSADNDNRLRGRYDEYFKSDEEAEKYARQYKII